MTPFHTHPPDALTPDERLREVAAILALGVIRLRTPPLEKPGPERALSIRLPPTTARS